MKRANKLLAYVGGIGLLIGGAFALSDGDFLMSQDYVDEIVVPQMEEAIDDHITSYLGEIYTESEAQLDQGYQDILLQMGLEDTTLVSTQMIPMDYGQGDIVYLEAGGTLLVTAGMLQLIHNGAVVDATTGTLCASGSYTEEGHRYIVAENTQLTATVLSGLACFGYEGNYAYAGGTGKNHPFYDVYRFDSYNDAVTFVYSNNLFSGMGDGTFAPANSMTRAMVVTVLYRLAGEPTNQMEVATGSFSDVSEDSWYADYVRWGASQGVTSGMGDGTFAPESGVTIAQMLQFLYSFGRNNLGLNLSGSADLSTVSGGDSVPDWVNEAAQWAVSSGVWTATLADREAMRAEVSTMITNFVKIYG